MVQICHPYEVIILGKTLEGRVFRPSDWAERLSGILCSFGHNNKMAYSPYVRPMMVDGIRAVAVHRSLQSINPLVFDFLLGFAKDNHLTVMDCTTLVVEHQDQDNVCPIVEAQPISPTETDHPPLVAPPL